MTINAIMEKIKKDANEKELCEKLIQTAEEDGAEVMTYTTHLADTGLLPYLPAQIIDLLRRDVYAYYTFIPGRVHNNGLVTDGQDTFINDGHGNRIHAIGWSTDIVQRGQEHELVMLCHEYAHVMTGSGKHDEQFRQYFEMLVDTINDYTGLALTCDLIAP